jgi:hypothetical protein
VSLAAMPAADRPRYTSAVCKGSGLLNDMKSLLRAWEPGESAAVFRDRVRREGILGKATAKRADDVVCKVFAPRFLGDAGEPAALLKDLLHGRNGGRVFSDICLLYAARQDALLRDAIVEVYWPALSQGRLALSTIAVTAWLDHARADGRIPERWSKTVRERVAQGVVRILTDFGLLGPPHRGRRETLNFRPSDGAVVYLAHELHFAGATDAGVVSHRDWALFGLREREVIATMDRLAGDGWWVVQAAGSVVRITWKYRSMQEVVDALSG